MTVKESYDSKRTTSDAPEKLSVYNFIALAIKMGYEPIIGLKKVGAL